MALTPEAITRLTTHRRNNLTAMTEMSDVSRLDARAATHVNQEGTESVYFNLAFTMRGIQESLDLIQQDPNEIVSVPLVYKGKNQYEYMAHIKPAGDDDVGQRVEIFKIDENGSENFLFGLNILPYTSYGFDYTNNSKMEYVDRTFTQFNEAISPALIQELGGKLRAERLTKTQEKNA